MESFACMMKIAPHNRCITGFQVGERVGKEKEVCHMLYAYDTIIFGGSGEPPEIHVGPPLVGVALWKEVILVKYDTDWAGESDIPASPWGFFVSLGKLCEIPPPRPSSSGKRRRICGLGRRFMPHTMQSEAWLELRDEWRLENRKAFANILSDFVFGVSLFILLCFNESKVKLLKFTGYKILNNISDAGKAFLIILISDILLGYHSEYGWTTAVEMLVEHYGIEVDRSAITIFVCIVPVVTDTFVKLWGEESNNSVNPNKIVAYGVAARQRILSREVANDIVS
ncbi:hypothetical protein MTR67_031940 [Solanum verrucosum]|uniref:Chloroplast envelope membrane protein n=1 Tax=Solanum verrucosum TaxID=315347 RepID=A0AAF0ZH24_SOLVR|nr:hypothetical protein MTR67_031940 [Solanum verrucosum]